MIRGYGISELYRGDTTLRLQHVYVEIGALGNSIAELEHILKPDSARPWKMARK